LTTGGRDVAALAAAISGFVVVGPMELLMPEAAAVRFGGFVWLLMLALYGLCVTLLVLMLRPRLVLYNMTVDQLRPILANVVTELDSDARWAGDSLVMPRLGVQLTVEAFPGMRNVQLVAAGPTQSYGGWRRLESALAAALRETRLAPNPYGVSLIMFGVLMLSMVAYWMADDRDSVARALREMLRL